MNTETTYDGYAPAGEQAVATGFFETVKRAVRRVADSMMASYIERQTMRELTSLPDYVLRDIGVSRGDIRTVASDLARTRADAWARHAEGSNGFGG